MIGIPIQVEGEEAFANAFISLDAYIGDRRPAWPGVAKIARDHARRRFAAEGPGWEGLTEGYAVRKAEKHGVKKILSATGALEDSLTEEGAEGAIYDATPDTLTVGSSLPYARAHHFGLLERSLPARPIYLVDDELAREVAEVMERDLTDFAEKIGLAA